MSTGKVETASVTSASHHRAAFFRQSGWMMLTGTASGVLMYAVHMVAKQMPKEEYGLFTTLLQVISLMAIPAVGLQTIFAQQAAAAVTDEQQRGVASTFRGVWRAIFFIWLAMAAIVGVFWNQTLTGLKIGNPAALVVTVIIGLVAMWMPLVSGMLQGRQNFLWLGWTNIFNGIGRFGMVCVIVLLFHGWAAGAVSAVLFGMTTVIGVGGWQVRDVWRTKTVPADWNEWLRRVVPLTLGLGAATFMLSADMVFTRKFFPAEQTGYYAAAGMIGRALVFFTAPLTLVMFPKIAHSMARGEKTDVLAHALGLTLLAGGAAVIGCTLFPWLPIRIVYDKSFLDVSTPLVPWFAWCMLPLTLANVLIYALLARGRFAAVPWLVLIAIGYGVALAMVGQHAGSLADTQAGFRMMIQTIGVFGTLLLAVCAWFSFGSPKSKV